MVNIKIAEKLICEGVLKSVASIGFEKSSNSLLVNKKPNGVTWQLRFGARKDVGLYRVLISVFAGIRFDSVESFRNRSPENPLLPTISVPIHFLCHNRLFVEWDVELPDSIELIVRHIEDYALPFFKRYDELPVLLDALLSSEPKDWFAVARNERPELLAAILTTLGKVSDAREILHEAIEERRSKPLGHRVPFELMLERIRNIDSSDECM